MRLIFARRAAVCSVLVISSLIAQISPGDTQSLKPASGTSGHADFRGSWRLLPERSNVKWPTKGGKFQKQNDRNFLLMELARLMLLGVSLDAPQSGTLTVRMCDPNFEYRLDSTFQISAGDPFKSSQTVKCAGNGTECMIDGQTFSFKWEGATLVVHIQEMVRGKLTFGRVERWSLSSDGGTLTIDARTEYPREKSVLVDVRVFSKDPPGQTTPTSVSDNRANLGESRTGSQPLRGPTSTTCRLPDLSGKWESGSSPYRIEHSGSRLSIVSLSPGATGSPVYETFLDGKTHFEGEARVSATCDAGVITHREAHRQPGSNQDYTVITRWLFSEDGTKLTIDVTVPAGQASAAYFDTDGKTTTTATELRSTFSHDVFVKTPGK